MLWSDAKILWATVVSSVLSFSGPAAWAETFVSEFETSFDGWQQQWHKESPTGTDGVVTHSTERGYLDVASLKFDMGDGFGDDGTLWIEKQFAVDPGVPTNVALAFQQFNEFQSDFNTFEVKAAISTENPEQQADFTTIGNTDMAEGWVPFTHEGTINAPSGQVWVALGIRVAWETHRDYWIDHVVVSTTVIPEPSTAGLLLLGMIGATFLMSHQSASRQQSRQAESATINLAPKFPPAPRAPSPPPPGDKPWPYSRQKPPALPPDEKAKPPVPTARST